MQVSAGNLGGLVGYSFTGAQFVGVSIASFAQASDGTVIDVLVKVLTSASAPNGAGSSASYTVSLVEGTNQIVLSEFAATNGSTSFVQSVTYNVLAYDPQSLLVSTLTLPQLIAALQAKQSVAGQVGAITGGTPGQGATLRFTPGGSFTGAVACFASGTRIRAARGDVAIDRLRVGDLVPGQVSGRLRPIVWIGRRSLRIAHHPRSWDVAPVRIRAGALAPQRPRRDVLLSPDHAVLVDGALVPVRYLLNGATIVQEFVPAITYLHIELDAHDVVLADGLPCESFLDTGNRPVLGDAAAARPWRPPGPMIPSYHPQPSGEPR